jgi:hypothetical protein
LRKITICSFIWFELSANNAAGKIWEMTLLQIAIMAIISFTVTLYLSWRGDDDAVYQLQGRKPTQQQAAAHGRFVISKTLTTVSCGCSAAILINNLFGLSLSENGKLFIISVCIVFIYLAIGEAQNAIRRVRGRPEHPIIDIDAIRKMLGLGRDKE